MADETIPVPTVSPAASPAPVEASPSPAPVIEAAPAPVTAEVTPAPAPAAEPVAEKSLLGADLPKPAEPVKTEDKAPEAKTDAPVELKKEEGAQSDEPAPPPTYEAFKLPEGITLEDSKLGEFTKELAEFQVKTKAEQAFVQEFGQKLVDRHVAEVKNTIDRLNEHYTKQWEKNKSDWKEAVMKDPELGGNRQETVIKAAKEFVRTHGGTEAQQQEFFALMDSTGLGNHPAMIRILSKAGMSMSEGKPLPASKPVPQSKSKVATRYGVAT